MQTQKTSRIFGLDLIRAIAIVLVMFSHVYYLVDSSNPTVISLSGLSGFSGVELFFVLSGYLIGFILLKQFLNDDFTIQNVFVFIKRRWFRTLPNYYLILFINLFLAYWFQYPLQNWFRYFFFFQNFSTYSLDFFTESWSLSVEEWTYILLPFSLFLTLKLVNKLSKKWTFFSIVLFLIVLAHFFRFLNMINNDFSDMEIWNTNIKSIVIYRFDAILFGVLLAWIHKFYSSFLNKFKVYFLIIAAHLFVFQFVLLNVLQVSIISNPTYFLVSYFSLSSITFLLVLPFFIFWKKSNLISEKIIGLISKLSYSAYLIHYSVVIVLLKYFLHQYSIQFSIGFILFSYIGITFLCSYFLYHFFEKPLTNLRDKK